MITPVEAINSSFLATVHELADLNSSAEIKFCFWYLKIICVQVPYHYRKGAAIFRRPGLRRMKQTSSRSYTKDLWPRFSLFRPSPVSSHRTNPLFYWGSLAYLIFVLTSRTRLFWPAGLGQWIRLCRSRLWSMCSSGCFCPSVPLSELAYLERVNIFISKYFFLYLT